MIFVILVMSVFPFRLSILQRYGRANLIKNCEPKTNLFLQTRFRLAIHHCTATIPNYPLLASSLVTLSNSSSDTLSDYPLIASSSDTLSVSRHRWIWLLTIRSSRPRQLHYSIDSIICKTQNPCVRELLTFSRQRYEVAHGCFEVERQVEILLRSGDVGMSQQNAYLCNRYARLIT